MADQAVVHIGENSPEEVAYKLLRDIAIVEKKSFKADTSNAGWTIADRKWILQTYMECHYAVRNLRDPNAKS